MAKKRESSRGKVEHETDFTHKEFLDEIGETKKTFEKKLKKFCKIYNVDRKVFKKDLSEKSDFNWDIRWAYLAVVTFGTIKYNPLYVAISKKSKYEPVLDEVIDYFAYLIAFGYKQPFLTQWPLLISESFYNTNAIVENSEVLVDTISNLFFVAGYCNTYGEDFVKTLLYDLEVLTSKYLEEAKRLSADERINAIRPVVTLDLEMVKLLTEFAKRSNDTENLDEGFYGVQIPDDRDPREAFEWRMKYLQLFQNKKIENIKANKAAELFTYLQLAKLQDYQKYQSKFNVPESADLDLETKCQREMMKKILDRYDGKGIGKLSKRIVAEMIVAFMGKDSLS